MILTKGGRGGSEGIHFSMERLCNSNCSRSMVNYVLARQWVMLLDAAGWLNIKWIGTFIKRLASLFPTHLYIAANVSNYAEVIAHDYFNDRVDTLLESLHSVYAGSAQGLVHYLYARDIGDWFSTYTDVDLATSSSSTHSDYNKNVLHPFWLPCQKIVVPAPARRVETLSWPFSSCSNFFSWRTANLSLSLRAFQPFQMLLVQTY